MPITKEDRREKKLSNKEKAGRGLLAAHTYAIRHKKRPWQSQDTVDLLADLLHFSHHTPHHSAAATLRTAVLHFAAETDPRVADPAGIPTRSNPWTAVLDLLDMMK